LLCYNKEEFAVGRRFWPLESIIIYDMGSNGEVTFISVLCYNQFSRNKSSPNPDRLLHWKWTLLFTWIHFIHQ